MGRKILAITVAALVGILGVAAVLAYTSNADERAVASQKPVQVYVASGDIASGTTLKSAVDGGLLTKTLVAEKGAPVGALRAVDSGNENLVAVSSIAAGEFVLASRFGETAEGTAAIAVPAGKVAVAVELGAAARVGTFVVPGSTVTLFNTPPTGPTVVLLDDVQVIAVGASALTPGEGDQSESDDSTGTNQGTLLTVAVTSSQATQLVDAIQTGRVYAALKDTAPEGSTSATASTK